MVRRTLLERIPTNRPGVAVAVGDLVAIGSFVALGELRHGGSVAAGLETMAEFLAGWLLASLLVGVYRSPVYRQRSRSAVSVGIAWTAAVVVALLIRAGGDPAAVAPLFAAVAIGAGGGLLVLWRLVWPRAARVFGTDRKRDATK